MRAEARVHHHVSRAGEKIEPFRTGQKTRVDRHRARRILVWSTWLASAVAMGVQFIASAHGLDHTEPIIRPYAVGVALALIASPLIVLMHGLVVPPLLVLYVQYRQLQLGHLATASLVGVLVGLPFVGIWWIENWGIPYAFAAMTVTYPAAVAAVGTVQLRSWR